jgi:hypothetical protein
MSEEMLGVVRETISLPYTWTAGPVGVRFLKALKDKKIMGTLCPKCKRVLVPARRFCPRCFVDTTEWVEVSDKGTLKSFTLINYSFTGQPKNPPYLIGMIQLDKADTCLFHFLGGVDLSDIEKACKEVKVGMRVRALWKKKREGKIADIEHFEPIIEGKEA